MTMTNVTAGKKRIEIVDALRGFALFGIIIAHMNNQYYAGYPPPGHETMAIKNGFDNFLQLFHDIFIFGKFYTIFSFLFGLSFGIQLLNARAKKQPFAGRFAWRLVVLFMIGFLNHMHYRGDILVIYAVLGFFLLLFYKAGNKALLFWSFFFILNVPGFILKTAIYINSLDKPAVVQNQPAGLPAGIDVKKLQEDATVSYNMVKSGDYPGIVKTNITKEFQNKLGFQIISGRLFVTMGLFILGLYVAKKRIFENMPIHIKGIKKWLWVSLSISVLAVLLYALFGEKLFGQNGLTGLLVSILGDAFSPALSMVYVACFILLFQKEKWQRRLSGLVPMGRMGLTTYLTQTFFGVLLFYGYGLNMLDVIGNTVSFTIGIIIFIAQVYFSKWWMKNYYYGPFEWLWRSLTYFKVQPFKKSMGSETVIPHSIN
jgi:uncharacterized protein